MKRPHRMRQRGVSIVELLVAMGVFSVILLVATNVIMVNQRVAGHQIQQHQAREDAQMALARIYELFSSAAYVYPEEQTLQLPNGNVRTGPKTLALLLPWGTPYCNDGGSSPDDRYDTTSPHRDQYCFVVYQIMPRSNYISLLGANSRASGWVLTEGVYKWVDWPVNTLPTRNFASAHAKYSNEGAQVGVVADSVVRESTKVLMNSNSISRAQENPIDSVLKRFPETVNADDSYALIDNVSFELTLQYKHQSPVKETATLFARAIPRSAPPGTGN